MHVSRPSLTESAARHAAAASVRRATHTALRPSSLASGRAGPAEDAVTTSKGICRAVARHELCPCWSTHRIILHGSYCHCFSTAREGKFSVPGTEGLLSC